MKRALRLSILLYLLATVPAAPQTLVDVATDALDPFNLADTEPSIAVNPVTGQIVIVSFSEGWGPNAMAPVWKSDDDGTTWRKVFQIPQPAANLTGPLDQKVSFDAAGKLFIAELGAFPAQDFVFRQTGGADAPLTAGTVYGDDQPHLEVDRSGTAPCSGRLYSPWLSFALANPRSTVAWSANAGVAMNSAGAGNNTTFPNRTTRVAVAPDGKVYIVYKTREGTAADPNFENAHFRVNRSDDCGASWTGLGAAGVSVHGAAAVQTFFTNSFGNPAKGMVTRARSSDAWIAVDPRYGGDVYVAYVSRDSANFGQIYVARSTDAGATWTPTRVTDGTHHSAFPEIAVAMNGTVGVLYVDFDDSGATTIFRHRFARSFDFGVTWSDQILQSMDPAPLANATSGFLWGDYEGLTAYGNRFYGVFTGASIGRTVPQLDPIFFKEDATSFRIATCSGLPWLCDPAGLRPGGLVLGCTFPGCIQFDPLPKNCEIKFDCPGCVPGGLCPPFYEIFLDGLDPRIWNVTLIDVAGNVAPYQIAKTQNGVVVSFQPSQENFRAGQIGNYVLAFQMTSQGKPGVVYAIKARLQTSDRPYGSPPLR